MNRKSHLVHHFALEIPEVLDANLFLELLVAAALGLACSRSQNLLEVQEAVDIHPLSKHLPNPFLAATRIPDEVEARTLK